MFHSSFHPIKGNGFSANPETTTIPLLNLMRVELVFRFDDVGWLPPFRGSLWKGVLGPALKRLDAAGQWSLLASDKLPTNLFDWAFGNSDQDCLIPPDRNAIARPIIIDAPAEAGWKFIEPGKTMRIQFTLVGRFCLALKAVVEAFKIAGEQGLGRAITRNGQRGRASLISVHQVWQGGSELPLPIWNAESGWLVERPVPVTEYSPPSCPVHVEIVSPLRLAKNKRIIKPDQFSVVEMFSSLMWRLSALMASHEGLVLDVDFPELLDQANSLVMHNQHLQWKNDKRWSGTQEAEVPIGGITGGFDIDLSGCDQLFRFLWLAQWVNIGKGTFMGLGGIRLQPA